MSDGWRSKQIEDEFQVQLCDNCGNAYAVAYSPKLGKWVFICLHCNLSCSTIVMEDGEEIEIAS